MDLPFSPPPFGTLVIVGLGLLGGSIAAAAKRRGLVRDVVAVARRGGADLEPARAAGLVDRIEFDEKAALASASLVVLCRPVDSILGELGRVMAAVPRGCIVTDVGSTKAAIVAAGESAERLANNGAHFVGSHPMAGSEKTGWRHANERLFEAACCLVTPTNATNPEAAARVGSFWRALGGDVHYLGPERHDALTAMVSHSPHLVAVALMEALRQTGEEAGLVALVSGTGLRDTTRVALGPGEVWEPICRTNAGPIAAELDRVAERLHALAALMRAGDWTTLRAILDGAAAWRRAIHDRPLAVPSTNANGS